MCPKFTMKEACIKLTRIKIQPHQYNIISQVILPLIGNQERSRVKNKDTEIGNETDKGANSDNSSTTVLYMWPDIPVFKVGKNSSIVIKSKPKALASHCVLSLRTKKKLAKFSVTTHGISKRKTKYWFKCKVPKCNQSFPTIILWNQHHGIQHKNHLLRCIICERTFQTLSAKRAHCNAHVELKHQFPDCLKCFNYASALKQHRTMHISTIHHKCFASGCNSSYKWPQDLSRHVKTHVTGSNKFMCLDCNMSFREERLLKRHGVKHLDIYKCVCSRCGFKTKWLSPYQRHVLRCTA